MDIQTATIVITGIGVLIAAVNQIYTSRQANQQRQIQLFNEIYNNVLNREFRRDYEIIVFSTTFSWDNWDDWQAKYGVDVNPDAHVMYMNVWVVLAYICEVINKGLIDLELIDDVIQDPIIQFWEKYRMLIYEVRVRTASPWLGQDVEAVYNRIIQKRE